MVPLRCLRYDFYPEIIDLVPEDLSSHFESWLKYVQWQLMTTRKQCHIHLVDLS